MKQAIKISAFLLAASVFSDSCLAVFTLQIDHNIAGTFTVVDGDANDTTAAGDGLITVDMSTAFGGVWTTDFNLDITADASLVYDLNPRLASDDGGRISVTADFDRVGAIGSQTVEIAAAETFDSLAGATVPITHFKTEFSGEITGQSLIGNPTLTGESAFSTGPLPGSLFDFSQYKFNQTPTPIVPAGLGTFEEVVISNPMGTHGLELAIGQRITIATGGVGDAGSVTLTTVVNPEPASLLLSFAAAGVFGFGYIRRRRSAEQHSDCETVEA